MVIQPKKKNSQPDIRTIATVVISAAAAFTLGYYLSGCGFGPYHYPAPPPRPTVSPGTQSMTLKDAGFRQASAQRRLLPPKTIKNVITPWCQAHPEHMGKPECDQIEVVR